MGAILFGVANWVHIHLKPTSMCGINVVGGGGGFRLKPHIEVRLKWMWFPMGFFKVQISHSGRAQRRSLILLRQGVYHSSLTGASTARFDFVVTMFRVGKIDEDSVDCPRFVAFKGASREDSSSSFNLGQLTKRIHGESDEFDEEEARQAPAQRSTKTGAISFGVANWVHIHLKPTSMCGINVVGGGGGCWNNSD